MITPSKEFPIAFVVLASDPTRADAVLGYRWMVFGSAAGEVVCSSAKLQLDIRWEAVGIVLGRYGGNQRTNWSGVFLGYGQV